MIESFDNQVIFKLATIETQVKAMSENLVTAIHRLEEKINADSLRLSGDTAKLSVKVDANEIRLKALEDYKNQLVAKVAGVTSVAAIFWIVFGRAIETQVAHIF